MLAAPATQYAWRNLCFRVFAPSRFSAFPIPHSKKGSIQIVESPDLVYQGLDAFLYKTNVVRVNAISIEGGLIFKVHHHSALIGIILVNGQACSKVFDARQSGQSSACLAKQALYFCRSGGWLQLVQYDVR